MPRKATFTTEKFITITFKLPLQLKKRLKCFSSNKNITLARTAQIAIEQYLDKKEK